MRTLPLVSCVYIFFYFAMVSLSSAQVETTTLVNGKYLNLSFLQYEVKEEQAFLQFTILRNNQNRVIPATKMLIEVYGKDDQLIESKNITRQHIQFGRIAKNNKRRVSFGTFLETAPRQIEKIEVSILDSEESIAEKEKITEERLLEKQNKN